MEARFGEVLEGLQCSQISFENFEIQRTFGCFMFLFRLAAHSQSSDVMRCLDLTHVKVSES